MVELSGIRKTYRQGGATIHALDGIDLTIRPGEFVAIMGPSGSGKSTLLNVLGALDRPDAGRYRLGADQVGELDDDAASSLRNRRIGFVFQSFHLLPRLTVLENVLLPQRYALSADADAEPRARALLQRIGLGSRLDHRPGELSGGQLQRAAIARALLNQPALLHVPFNEAFCIRTARPKKARERRYIPLRRTSRTDRSLALYNPLVLRSKKTQ